MELLCTFVSYTAIGMILPSQALLQIQHHHYGATEAHHGTVEAHQGPRAYPDAVEAHTRAVKRQFRLITCLRYRYQKKTLVQASRRYQPSA
jgi:hypothetical protein